MTLIINFNKFLLFLVFLINVKYIFFYFYITPISKTHELLFTLC